MSSTNQQTGWIFVWIVCLFPIVLWFFAPASVPRFNSIPSTLLSISKLAALVGTSMFALTLFLSARIKIFEKFFNGLNQVYERHSQLGQIAMILLMFHPLLMLPQYTSSISDAAKFLLPGSNWSNNWGLFSLGLMITLIVLTLYLRPRYNIWKITHKFLGLAFFLGALHVWLTPSDTASYLPLRYYVLGLSALGLLAFMYRTILGQFLVKYYRYQVASIRNLNSAIVEICLTPLKPAFNFVAGQFIFIKFKNSQLGNEGHPFSIVSPPGAPELKLAVKNLGDYTAELYKLEVGTDAIIEGPFGAFSHKTCEHFAQIWIAGGVGITPFISMAESLTASQCYQIDLFYCVRNVEEAIYLDELNTISANMPDTFHLHLFNTDERGRLTADAIQRESVLLNHKDIFICAPPGMIHALHDQFIAKNISPQNIHSEEFNF